MAWWIALLLVGVVVVLAATITLITDSSARTQAAAAEQKYFATTSSSRSIQHPQPDASEPLAYTALSTPVGTASKPEPIPKPRSPSSASALASTATTGSAPTMHPSTPRIAVMPPSIPTSIELANSRNPIRVVPISVSAAGVLEPPADISTAGWWVSGPRPGSPGRAVITGHIDSTAGMGAFAALDLLHDGDHIALNEANGRILHFEVTARQEIEKTQLDPRLLQHTTNVSDLLLVTCIGDFNYSTRSYESNLLITAVPVPQKKR